MAIFCIQFAGRRLCEAQLKAVAPLARTQLSMGLDTVEIVMGWEQAFGISITDAEAAMLRTPRQVVDLVVTKLDVRSDVRRPCLTLRAFLRLRRSITDISGLERREIRPGRRIKDLIVKDGVRAWDAVRSECRCESLPKPGWAGPATIGEYAAWMVSNAPREIKPPGEPWSRSEIRAVVRAVTAEIVSLEGFGDDDDFIRDLGLN